MWSTDKITLMGNTKLLAEKKLPHFLLSGMIPVNTHIRFLA
jgi:hypothetical protein